jgi:hypothetical protein
VIGRDWVAVSSFDEQDVYGHDPNGDVTIQISFEPGISYSKFKGTDPIGIRTLYFEYSRYKIGEERVIAGWSKNALTSMGSPR